MNFKIGIFTFLSFIIMACSSDSHTYNNPNLLDINVNFDISLSLPKYIVLEHIMNPVYVANQGNGGVIITKSGPDTYVAFDAADPNHPRESCSVLELNGIEGVCQCDDHNTYNVVSGTVIEDKSEGEEFEYAMKPYNVIDNKNGTLTIKN